jgi:hypothetical protein
VLVVDMLQAILNRAMQQDHINAPLPGPAFLDFPVIQYVDDTLVVMKADGKQLLCLKAILQSFADSTGLIVNPNKSSMMPINMSQERLQHFANTLQCRTGCLPFTYLGLPLGTTKPSLDHFMPIVQRVEKRLYGIVEFLDYKGKLLIVKSVLASMPISFMACLDIHPSIKDQLVKYMRKKLWRKKNIEVQSKGPALIAWEKIAGQKTKVALESKTF